MLGGTATDLKVEPGPWIAVFQKMTGSEVQLLQKQVAVLAPVKVTPGPVLRSEWPGDGGLRSSFELVRWALMSGLSFLNAGLLPSSLQSDGEQAEVLEDWMNSGKRSWTRRDGSWLTRVESGRLSQKITARQVAGVVVFEAMLLRLRDPGPEMVQALSHFLLCVDERLRLIRGVFSEQAVQLQAVLPLSRWDAGLAEVCINCLVAGTALVKRECAVLHDREAARIYCECHLNRKEGTQCKPSI